MYLSVYRRLYKSGRFAEAYSCGTEAMKIHSGHEHANRFVAEIRDILCKCSVVCDFHWLSGLE